MPYETFGYYLFQVKLEKEKEIFCFDLNILEIN